MNHRPRRDIKPPSSLKEYEVAEKPIEGEDVVQQLFSYPKLKNPKTFQSRNFIKCKKCNVKFNGKNRLLNHLKKHKGKENFLCEDCGKSLSSLQAFSEHSNIHKDIKPYKCEVCGHESRQSSVHSRHMLTHEENPIQKFKCTICEKVFKLNTYFKQHMRKHKGEKPFVCDQCGKGFTVKCELNRHMVKHSSARPFECQYCSKKFKLKHNLNTHIKNHTSKRLWRCCLCKASFHQQSLMEEHKKSHTEVVQHLELVKTDQRTLSITSYPLDKRKVPHHQELILPSKLDLNNSENPFNSKVSLGLNDAVIPISIIANSFGTGNYIEMKIVDKIDLVADYNLKKVSINDVTNAVLVKEDSFLSESDDDKPVISSESRVNDVSPEDNGLKETKNSKDHQQNAAKTEICSFMKSSFEEIFKNDFAASVDERKVSWLKSFVEVVKELQYPLDFEVSQHMHSVVSKLQVIFANAVREKRKACEVEINASPNQSDTKSIESEENEKEDRILRTRLKELKNMYFVLNEALQRNLELFLES